MAMPLTKCATPPWVWPATITSTSPVGNFLAAAKSSPSLQLEVSRGSAKSLQRAPACAATTTASAPCARSRRASLSIAGARDSNASPATLREMVVLRRRLSGCANQAHAKISRAHEAGRKHVLPVHRLPCLRHPQVGREKWKACFGGSRPQGALWVLPRLHGRLRGSLWPKSQTRDCRAPLLRNEARCSREQPPPPRCCSTRGCLGNISPPSTNTTPPGAGRIVRRTSRYPPSIGNISI